MAENNKLKELNSREAILYAGALCFMEKGFAATSIDDIAERIGATKGMVYHYFSSKGELFIEIQQKGMDALFRVINPFLQKNLSPLEQFTAMCRAHVRTLLETQPYQRTLSEGVHMHLRHKGNLAQGEQLKQVQRRRVEYEEIFLNVFMEGVKKQQLHAKNPRLAVRLILAGFNSVIAWYQPRENETHDDREAFIATVVNTVLHGVLTPVQ